MHPGPLDLKTNDLDMSPVSFAQPLLHLWHTTIGGIGDINAKVFGYVHDLKSNAFRLGNVLDDLC